MNDLETDIGSGIQRHVAAIAIQGSREDGCVDGNATFGTANGNVAAISSD